MPASRQNARPPFNKIGPTGSHGPDGVKAPCKANLHNGSRRRATPNHVACVLARAPRAHPPDPGAGPVGQRQSALPGQPSQRLPPSCYAAPTWRACSHAPPEPIRRTPEPARSGRGKAPCKANLHNGSRRRATPRPRGVRACTRPPSPSAGPRRTARSCRVKALARPTLTTAPAVVLPPTTWRACLHAPPEPIRRTPEPARSGRVKAPCKANLHNGSRRRATACPA